ncbi:MAG: HAD family hydrolase [Elusimicrobia bacterium]|nr:HAD family hydrolase [Elusimicrobiota bacterium]MBI3013323.1 HAD family hydrolase [Elusimicrobiota bacterium]MBI4218059.1 HAD family hydrolase [Elusimicrobiota bacterium]
MDRAVFLDRDGTVIKDAHYLSHPGKIQIYKGVIPALKKLRGKGWKIIIGTNQSGVARGYLSLETLAEIHENLLSLFRKNDLKIDEIFFCPHHPKDRCHCRKPNLGILLKAAHKYRLDLKKCVVVGDKESDILWGKNGKTKTILVLTGKGKKSRAHLKTQPDHIASTLPHAVQWMLNHES